MQGDRIRDAHTRAEEDRARDTRVRGWRRNELRGRPMSRVSAGERQRHPPLKSLLKGLDHKPSDWYGGGVMLPMEWRDLYTTSSREDNVPRIDLSREPVARLVELAEELSQFGDEWASDFGYRPLSVDQWHTTLHEIVGELLCA
jgi:hypothetical protein